MCVVFDLPGCIERFMIGPHMCARMYYRSNRFFFQLLRQDPELFTHGSLYNAGQNLMLLQVCAALLCAALHNTSHVAPCPLILRTPCAPERVARRRWG